MTKATTAGTYADPNVQIPPALVGGTLRSVYPQGAFRHLILFKVHDGTPTSVVDEALRLMEEMCQDRGILYYNLGVSEDVRKGVILVELVDFVDEDAFEAFKATEPHKRFAQFIRNHADWIIGDYSV